MESHDNGKSRSESSSRGDNTYRCHPCTAYKEMSPPKVHPDIMEELFLLMGAEVMRWNPRGQIVCNVGEPGGLLCRDSKGMLVKKSIVEGDILALDNKPGKIISDDILDSCLVLDLPIKLRQE